MTEAQENPSASSPDSRSAAGAADPLADPAVIDRPVFGANLRGRTFREELGQGPTLLVFLRHFG
jgi:hypothetical protein